jgi:polar amino acid transport system substrate-binding protein
MKQGIGFLLTVAVAAVVAWGVVHVGQSQTGAPIASTQPVYDRVMQSKTLRCGYVVYPPTVIKDPNTGVISGLMHDVIENAAAKMGLKVEWTEEFNWGNYLTGLQYDHVDMICAAAWNNHAGEWQGTETIGPLFYSGIGVWVRADDDRFTGRLDKIDDPAVTISSIDGTLPGYIAAADFPKAKILGMPQATDYTFNLLNVADKKADVTFVENFQGFAFSEKNPGAIKNIAAENPIRVFPNVFLVRKGEQKLKNTFEGLLQYMINNGEMEPIIRKYEKYPGSFYRVAKPYQPPQK